MDRLDARATGRLEARVPSARRRRGPAVTTQPVLLEVTERIATVTLNRPEARNALSSEVLRLLPQLMREADTREDVDVVILTGADPAFCAGLDLKELGSSAGNLRPAGNADREAPPPTARGPFPDMEKPVIGAINGPAITGGFEIALNCDFLVASERARFGDTHTRVGVMPGWGLTVLLQQAIGVRRAKEMSVTGNFLDAREALTWGLVNHVVAHDELLPFCRRLAVDIIGNDQRGVRQISRTYDAVAGATVAEGWEIERRDSREWQRQGFDPAEVERRRLAIIERGRAQT
ncbi:MAG: enoyl-CoA hydratase [Actinobacteria bacterium]|nr:MAG: enoyl-CoA hydratase [Actinomycetota bacterium]